jgi:hypothetical protein
VIEVADAGIGLDVERVTAEPIEPTADGGRGLQLFRACTDGMELLAVHPHGLMIRMTKTLAWESSLPRHNGGQYPASAMNTQIHPA